MAHGHIGNIQARSTATQSGVVASVRACELIQGQDPEYQTATALAYRDRTVFRCPFGFPDYHERARGGRGRAGPTLPATAGAFSNKRVGQDIAPRRGIPMTQVTKTMVIGNFVEGRRWFFTCVWAGLCSALALPPATLGADNSPPPGFVALFNGRDLSGWKVPEGDGGHWKVVDGVIDY